MILFQDKLRNYYYFLLAALLFLGILRAAPFLLHPAEGRGDTRLLCSAARVLENHGDPYDPVQIKQYTADDHSFPYPMLYLQTVQLLCPWFEIGYPFLCLFLLLFEGAIILKFIPDARTEPVLLAGLFLTAFMAFEWLVKTSNPAAFETLFFIISFCLLFQNRFLWSGIFLGFGSSIKCLPLLFAGLYFLVPGKKDKIRALLGAGFGFFTCHLLSLAFSPALYVSYVELLLGLKSGHAPIKETFFPGETNPSLLSLLSWALQAHDGLVPFWGVGAVYFCFVGFHAFLYRLYLAATTKTEWMKAYFYGVLFILVSLPRLKPYTFSLALLPVFLLIYQERMAKKIGLLVTACLLPLFFNSLAQGSWIYLRIFGYYQFAALWLTYLLLFFFRSPLLTPPKKIDHRNDPRRLENI